MANSDEGTPVDSIKEIERRQDEVLQQLELLETRLVALLSDYACSVPATKKAA